MNPWLRIGHLNCHRLWRIWNIVIIIILYTYSIYHSILLYIEFKSNTLDIAYGRNYCPGLLNFTLACIIASLTLIMLAIYCLMFYNGNIADDGIRLGDEECPDVSWLMINRNYCCHLCNGINKSNNNNNNNNNNNINNNNNNDNNDVDYLYHNHNIYYGNCQKFMCLQRFSMRLKRNFLPLSSFLHYLSALCLIIPLPFIEAKQIELRVLPARAIWHSDLDFLFEPDKWHPSFTSHDPNYQSGASGLTNSIYLWPVRPQFFNLAVSLITLSLRYATVFWCTNHAFSFIFSFIMILASIHIILDYSSTAILMRLFYNPDFVTSKLHTNLLSPIGIIILFCIGSTILLISFWTIFELGIQQYIHANVVAKQRSHGNINNTNNNCNTLNSDSIGPIMRDSCCHHGNKKIDQYPSNINKQNNSAQNVIYVFLAILACGIVVSIKILPIIVLGLYKINKYSPDPLIMTNVVISVILLITWLIAWFGYALKPSWTFLTPMYSKAVSEISSVTNVMNHPNNNHRSSLPDYNSSTVIQPVTPNIPPQLTNSNSSNQVYSCFHDSTIGLMQQQQGYDESGGSLKRRDYYMDGTIGSISPGDMENSGISANANYVYLQSTMNPAGLSQSHQMQYLEQVDESNNDSGGGGGGIVNSAMLLGTLESVARQQQNGTNGTGGNGSAAVSESDSSYDSASNIRNQLLSNNIGPNIDQLASNSTFRSGTQIGSLKNSNVLKYVSNTSGSLRFPSTSNTNTSQPLSATEYIQMQSANYNELGNGTNKGGVSLQRQSSKKKIVGQRVTFKEDSQLQDLTSTSPTIHTKPSTNSNNTTTEKSPNNSEHDSNNTTSSDSGIDSTSKQQQIQQQHQRGLSFTYTNNTTLSQTTPSQQPRASSVTPLHPYNNTTTQYPHSHHHHHHPQQSSACTSPLIVDNTYYNFFTPTTTTTTNNNNSNNNNNNSNNNTDNVAIQDNELGATQTTMDTQSFMSDATEQDRLCSQV